MKSKTWALILATVLVVCVVLSVALSGGDPAARAEISSDGQLVQILDLTVDQQLTVQTEHGINVVTVRDGKIAVTEASCPDQICVARGYCNSGTQIVCLPNRLVIRFLGEQEIDGAVG